MNSPYSPWLFAGTVALGTYFLWHGEHKVIGVAAIALGTLLTAGSGVLTGIDAGVTAGQNSVTPLVGMN